MLSASRFSGGEAVKQVRKQIKNEGDQIRDFVRGTIDIIRTRQLRQALGSDPLNAEVKMAYVMILRSAVTPKLVFSTCDIHPLSCHRELCSQKLRG
jgi:hypothetical protein